MASFGNLNAALSSFRAESTNALVNVNFELNFLKNIVPPPTEYSGVGENLALSRRREEQEGPRHVLARKLGALFKEKLSPTPTDNLIKAYGTRASEIASSPSANPRGDASHGPFAEWIGADATTLWAAATSGRPAIKCHLLACLLARMWEPPEATSIWVEIVTKRQDQLKTQLANEGEIDSEALLAMAENFSRSDLHDWDASARAWLRVADKAMAKQQTQLRLIVDNVHLPVNTKPDTYDSVMDAWLSAMDQMERLLAGSPLQVHDGGILLGLLSWHLYPDMRHLSTRQREIKQHDPLLEGRGILTLGLEPSPRVLSDERQSVFWSLPLAHLRFYGRLPITRTQSVRITDRDRITIPEYLWVMLSVYTEDLDDADVPVKDQLQYVSNFAIELHWALGYEPRTYEEVTRDSRHRSLSTGAQTSWVADTVSAQSQSWLTMLSWVAMHYRDRLQDERVRKLRNMGRKFGWLLSGGPFFGLFSLDAFLRAGMDLKDKIEVLREVASSALGEGREQHNYEFIIIIYKHNPHMSDIPGTRSANGPTPEYLTAVPEHRVTDYGIDRDSPRVHRRWQLLPALELLTSRKRGWQEDDSMTAQYLEEHGGKNETVHFLGSSYPIITPIEPQQSSEPVVLRVQFQPEKDSHEYTLVCGDLFDIALLQKQPARLQTPQRLCLGIRDLIRLFRPEKVSFKRCAEILENAAIVRRVSTALEYKKHLVWLSGLTAIESLYRSMPDATVDVRVVQMKLEESRWLRTAISNKEKGRSTPVDSHQQCFLMNLDAEDLAIAECFACIAMMETGTKNLDPSDVNAAFALCSADNLYIASALLRDPSQDSTQQPIRRFTGNIGKAGMAFLVCPEDPEIKSYGKIDEWYQFDHKEFDGNLDDCFGGTSLHLSFSQWTQAINDGTYGGRDVEVYFMEALISVYDRETWIAELDIPNLFKARRLEKRFLKSKECQCTGSARTRGTRIVSIDNFAEMIVPPRRPGIVRARGNWQARLVAACLCIAREHQVILKPENTCWGCLSATTVDDVSVQSILEDPGSSEVVIIL